MDILIKITQLLLSLSILVVVHEFGHFLFAKLFKTKVEKFYLFFDPWFSIFKYKKGETEYGVGWIPLGGYVKIAGMIDESMDKEQMKKPPKSWEFRAKPSWQRLLIMIGGVLFNFLLAIAIYISILFAWGEKYLPLENAKYGIVCDSIAFEMNLKNGDKILSFDDKKVDNFRKIIPHILLNQPKTIQIERDGKIKNIDIPKDLIANIIKRQSFISLGFPFIVAGFTENSHGKESGLKIGDKIIGINEKKLNLFADFPPVLKELKNQVVDLVFIRNGDTLKVKTKISEEGLIGVYYLQNKEELFDLKTVEYSFFESIPAGFSRGYQEVGSYLKQFKLIFSPETEAYKSVGGFIAIGNIFPDTWDWRIFWSMTALLSIMLGVVNILPIPALDGGHVLFLLYEIIARRKPSDKFMEYAQVTGMIILLSLVVFANGNDIIKLFE